MNQNTDFFYAHIGEFLEGSLDPKTSEDFENALKADANLEKKLDQFRQFKGKLQLELQKIQLSNNEIQELRHLLEPKEVTETIETQQIDAASQSSYWQMLLRGAAILVILVGGGFLFYKYFAPAKKEKFNSLEALTYEALALEQDGVSERFNFPSQNLEEIKSYFLEAAQLGFAFPILTGPAKKGFVPEGASVIDYEVAQIGAIAFSHTNGERVFYFAFEGALNKLPASSPIHQGSYTYQPYASSELNLIAWQAADGVLAFMVGRLATTELANLAFD